MANGQAGWPGLIEHAASERAATISAHTYYGVWPTASRPAKLECDDGTIYVVKGRQNRRMIVSERIVAHLAGLVVAPTPEVAYINVPQLLISHQPELAHFEPGVSHGAEFVPGCGDRAA